MAQISHSVSIGDSNVHSGNIIGSFNTTFYGTDEDKQIMGWLSPMEPNKRHQGVRTDRFDGVGDWLWKRASFGNGGVVRVEPIKLSCFAPGIREWARHI